MGKEKALVAQASSLCGTGWKAGSTYATHVGRALPAMVRLMVGDAHPTANG